MLKIPKHPTPPSTIVSTLLIISLFVSNSAKPVPFCKSLESPGVSKTIIRMVLLSNLKSKSQEPKLEESFRIIKRENNEELTKNLQECKGITGLPQFHRCENDSEYLKISEQKFYMHADMYEVYGNLQKKSLPHKLRVYKGLAKTLEDIHNKGLYHLNINSSNIWADSEEVSQLFLSGIEFGKEIKGRGELVSWQFDSPLFYSLLLWTKVDTTQIVGIPDEVRALMLSILLIETDIEQAFCSGYRTCLSGYKLTRCFEAITELIENYFLKNEKSWEKQCGEKAVASYKKAFGDVFSIEKINPKDFEKKVEMFDNQLDSKWLVDIFDKAESECISSDKKDTESSKKIETRLDDLDLKRVSETIADSENELLPKQLKRPLVNSTQIIV
jgi:hypothetical protein